MIFNLILTALGAFLLFASGIAFLRSRDVFVMVHIIKTVNFYIIPLLLIAFALENFSAVSFAKIIIIILLNLITTILLCHAIAKRAIEDKITPDADSKILDMKKGLK